MQIIQNTKPIINMVFNKDYLINNFQLIHQEAFVASKNAVENYLKDFNKKFPDFDIILYKLSNPDLHLENDIKYKSYWYNNKIDDKICTNININLYKYIYNIEEFTEEDIKYFHNNSGISSGSGSCNSTDINT